MKKIPDDKLDDMFREPPEPPVKLSPTERVRTAQTAWAQKIWKIRRETEPSTKEREVTGPFADAIVDFVNRYGNEQVRELNNNHPLVAAVPPSDWRTKIDWMVEDCKRRFPTAKNMRFNWDMDTSIPDLFEECAELYFKGDKAQMTDYVIDHYKSQDDVGTIGGMLNKYLGRLIDRKRR